MVRKWDAQWVRDGWHRVRVRTIVPVRLGANIVMDRIWPWLGTALSSCLQRYFMGKNILLCVYVRKHVSTTTRAVAAATAAKNHTTPHHTPRHHTAQQRTTPHHIAPHCAPPHSTAQQRTALHHTAWHHTRQHSQEQRLGSTGKQRRRHHSKECSL